MVNFWAMDTVPAQFRSRLLYRHNPNVTLMRTTSDEMARIGRFIAEKLNRMQGPVRFLIPEGGVSGIDAPGKPSGTPRPTRCFSTRSLLKQGLLLREEIQLPHHINDPAFADALVANFNELAQTAWPASLARTS